MNTKNKSPSIHNSFINEIKPITEILDKYPFEKKQAYGYFLNQQYLLIRHSTRLLALAASKVNTEDRLEFRWWAEHLQEEIDHDQLIINDMIAIGYTHTKKCEPTIRGLSLALFEDIRCHGQDALLGYALMLEGLSMERCTLIARRIEDTYGAGYSYLRLHAIADDKHFPQGIKRLEGFSAKRRDLVLENLAMSACLYRNFLQKITSIKY